MMRRGRVDKGSQKQKEMKHNWICYFVRKDNQIKLQFNLVKLRSYFISQRRGNKEVIIKEG